MLVDRDLEVPARRFSLSCPRQGHLLFPLLSLTLRVT
jgi:hypothetical protein